MKACIRSITAIAVLMMALSFACSSTLRAAEAGGAATAVAGEALGATTTVLVLIDIQNFYFPGGSLPLVEPEAATRQARKVLDQLRALGWPVVHVQHLPKAQSVPTPDSGDPQYRIHATVVPRPEETVIGKHHANAFRDTTLRTTLATLGARRLVIAGMQTHMCVEAAARAAADLGLDVTVVQDACATRDLEFRDATIPAAQVHASTLATLQGNYAKVMSAEDLLEELPRRTTRGPKRAG